MSETKTHINPLIARAKLPGETFAIPSGGIFYENDELDDSVINGEVHIHPMAAYDEILIKTPALLLNGDAVEKVFNRCIPQIKKPMDLLAKDVDYLLMALRQVTYGKIMEVNFKHNCENAKSHSYNVDISKLIRDSKKINPTTINKNYTIRLKNEQTVELRPASYKDIVNMLQLFSSQQSYENQEITDEQMMIRAEKDTNAMLKTIQSIIRSVDSVTDKNDIWEWLQILDAPIVNELAENVEKTSNWGPSFEHKTKCKDCNKTITINVPINPVSFFT